MPSGDGPGPRTGHPQPAPGLQAVDQRQQVRARRAGTTPSPRAPWCGRPRGRAPTRPATAGSATRPQRSFQSASACRPGSAPSQRPGDTRVEAVGRDGRLQQRHVRRLVGGVHQALDGRPVRQRLPGAVRRRSAPQRRGTGLDGGRRPGRLVGADGETGEHGGGADHGGLVPGSGTPGGEVGAGLAGVGREQPVHERRGHLAALAGGHPVAGPGVAEGDGGRDLRGVQRVARVPVRPPRGRDRLGGERVEVARVVTARVRQPQDPGLPAQRHALVVQVAQRVAAVIGGRRPDDGDRAADDAVGGGDRRPPPSGCPAPRGARGRRPGAPA